MNIRSCDLGLQKRSELSSERAEDWWHAETYEEVFCIA